MILTIHTHITIDEPDNFLILGNWSALISYKLSDMGIPVVKVPDGTSLGYSVYSLNVDSSTIGDSPAGTGSSEWKLVESVEFIYMQQAYIERLQFESAAGGGFEIKDGYFQSKAKDTHGNPIIILNGNDGGIITKTGEFENVKINGGIRSTFTEPNDSLFTGYNDNISAGTPGTFEYIMSLPWDTSQSGRRITIANWKWTQEYNGGLLIGAPSGQYFFENGKSFQSLRANRELVELLGYGTGDDFFGWIVVNRIDFMPAGTYGKPNKVIAQGLVFYNGTGPHLNYNSFDGSLLSVERRSVGTYRISFPSSWNLDIARFDRTNGNCIVMLTGYLSALDSNNNPTNSPIKATLGAFSPTGYFDVVTSDDETLNDGSFMFQIINMMD